ncbi:MAG TPA: cytochrome c [Patescibacteria group bacterium]|nr:cytochrome c [Patescibacteria group bacterium]
MIGSKRSLILAVVMAGLTPVFLPGCSRSVNRANAREIARGRILFEVHCLGCHGGRIHTLARRPPRLNGIFQRKYLPSGEPATDSQVRATIQDGRAGIMPPFQNILSKQDIRDITAYLHTLKPLKASPSGNSADGTQGQPPGQPN